MPVIMARNNQDGPTVLSSDPKGSVFVEWQGKGDPSGNDVQPVPEEVQATVSFQRCLRRGIFTILNDNEGMVEEAMARQQAAWDKRQNATQESADSSIDRQANNDIITAKCVGPSSRGTGRCGEDVPVKDLSKNDKPPLCARHTDLAAQYVPSEEMVDGHATTVWIRSTMGPRESSRG